MVQLPSDTSKCHLLLIDDHPIVLAGIRNILEVCPEIGEIYAADSAAKALELLKSHDISICMVDIELPDMSGFELIEQIRLSIRICVLLLKPCIVKCGLSVGW
ncbi:MAG: response regulator transcription factor [Bacteroides cellulosilyticus]